MMKLMQTRRFLLLLLLLLTFSCLAIAASTAGAKSFVYVGTYTDKGSKGIYSYQFDPATGGLTSLGLIAETPNPTFLALDPTHKFLYAVNEISSYNGKPAGEVSAFAVGSAGRLSPLNQVSARDEGPAHITVDRTGKYVLIANYPRGSITVFPVLKDGSLGEASAFVQHKGSSVNPKRQSGPHGHAVVMSPDDRFVLVADLGLDQVLVYPFDAAKGTLGQPNIARVKPGSGPRHLVFASTGKFVYLVNEMFSNITVFSYDAASGALAELQTVSMLSKGFTGQSTAAEIALHPSGKFLYASNRGEDSIAVFAVDVVRGTLTSVENVPTQGKEPRNFAIDPSGLWLLAANQGSNNIVTFRIDPKTGRLTPAGPVVEVASPVCIQFDAPTRSKHK
jgi:6-phosphogluconolactonase